MGKNFWNRKKNYALFIISGLIILSLVFSSSIKEKVSLVKSILWFMEYKNKYPTPPEIILAEKLPAEASMAEIYKALSPIYNKNTLNMIGKMQESMFTYVAEHGKVYTELRNEANYLLAQGEIDKAIAILSDKKRSDLTEDELELLGVAYLRLGEKQNCIDGRNQDSCLFPIRGLGIHRLRKGGEEAVSVFQNLVSINPGRFDWRWLLHISAMTVNQFPEAVPAALRINPEQMKSEIDFPRFFDVAQNIGLQDFSVGGGVIMDDFNNDGYLDIVNVSGFDEGYHNKLFINDGKGHFVDKTEKSGFMGIPTGLNMLQADYNNDGFLDILVLRGGWLSTYGELPSTLFKNNGDGTFTDVTKEAGLLYFAPTQTAVWTDFDNDGDLDLFVGTESTYMKEFKCKYFENLGNGKFKERTDSVGLNISGYMKGAVAIDYNNDGWDDLAITDTQKRKVLIYKNMGRDKKTHQIHFEKAAELDSSGPFAIASFDYDNDGWPDLMIPGYELSFSKAVTPFFEMKGKESPGNFKFYKNEHGVFKDVAASLNLNVTTMTMGLNYGDIDNDGFIDFYLGTGGPSFAKIVPNRMFRNNEGKNFQDITSSGGFGNLQKGHGIAFGDFDNDGQVDVYSSLGGVFASDYYQDALFHNPGNHNHWIKIKLHGVKSNRFGVGAKIKVTTDRGSFYRRMDTGGSFGANPLLAHIGLGKSTNVQTLEINWPGNNVPQIFKNVGVDRRYEVTENLNTLKKF